MQIEGLHVALGERKIGLELMPGNPFTILQCTTSTILSP
jgi:hypothetical protein